MDFPKILKQKQREKHMSNEAFSKYLSMSRTWLQSVYASNEKIPKHTVSELTMIRLHEALDIPYDVMNEYNRIIGEKYNIHKIPQGDFQD